jgi:hypothetical protein
MDRIRDTSRQKNNRIAATKTVSLVSFRHSCIHHQETLDKTTRLPVLPSLLLSAAFLLLQRSRLQATSRII